VVTTRREFLGSLFVGITALGAGCVDSPSSGGNSSATPSKNGSRSATSPTTPTEAPRTNPSTERTRTTETAEATDDVPVREPPACDGSVHRLSPPIDEVRYGSLGGFTLTASDETVARGETISFWLENATDSERTTGNERKYDVQRRTDGGWRSIHWIPERYGYNAVGVLHPPGTGFTWKFPLAPSGLEQSTRFNTPYSVCEPIPSGAYRFVYGGLVSETERGSDFETEYAIGVRFTVGKS
jgi:hypothetical protein